MSDSVQHHRRQPTRLPCIWDSPGCHFVLQCMKLKSESEVARSCPTLSDPMDYSLPGSSVHGMFQARMLEWVAILFSRGSSRPRDLLDRGVEPASLVSPAFIQLYQTGSPIYILQSYPIKHKNLVRGWFFFLLRQIFSFSSAQFSTHPKDGLVENILP